MSHESAEAIDAKMTEAQIARSIEVGVLVEAIDTVLAHAFGRR